MFEVSQVHSPWKDSLPWDRTAELRRQDMDGGVEVQKTALAHTLGGQKQVRFQASPEMYKTSIVFTNCCPIILYSIKQYIQYNQNLHLFNIFIL